MLKFEPPQLAKQISEALRRIEKELGIEAEELEGDFLDPGREDFDPSDYEDEIITAQSRATITLPRCDDSLELGYQDLIALSEELLGAELDSSVRCWARNRVLLRVEPVYNEALRRFEALTRDATILDGRLDVFTTTGNATVRCSIARGITHFALLVVRDGRFDKYLPPADEQEYFVHASWNGELCRVDANAILEAYRFELNASLNVELRASPWPELEDLPLEWEGEEDEAAEQAQLRLRPLLLGRGLSVPVSLYNEAGSSADPAFEILTYTKVLEYVAQTVMRIRLTDAIRRKLQSPQALDPNADFILELEAAYNEQRAFRKEREALRLTVAETCDALALARIAPPYLATLATLSTNADLRASRKALEAFADGLSATRNWIAHAKAAYVPTGEECPEAQLSQLASCAKVAAQQAIRWYASRHEALRVT